ncbi:MAG: hypothetical protein IKA69_03875 [Kiritimatiellae bacterium]|nr:hypothetical protein [Kiritimatiellia bacterium]
MKGRGRAKPQSIDANKIYTNTHPATDAHSTSQVPITFSENRLPTILPTPKITNKLVTPTAQQPKYTHNPQYFAINPSKPHIRIAISARIIRHSFTMMASLGRCWVSFVQYYIKFYAAKANESRVVWFHSFSLSGYGGQANMI